MPSQHLWYAARIAHGGLRCYVVLMHIRVDVGQAVEWGRNTIPRGMPLCLPFSGGLDSATTLALAVETFGPENVIPIRFVHNLIKEKEEAEADDVARALKVKPVVLDIQELLDASNSIVENLTDLSERPMLERPPIIQYAAMIYTLTRKFARKADALVLGTLDLTEILVGYFPKETFGGDLMWIGGMTRSEVRSVAGDLGLKNLSEGSVSVEGCGAILEHVNRNTDQSDIKTEEELDEAVLKTLKGEETPVNAVMTKMLHKAQNTISGRPVYYPTEARKTKVERYLKRMDSEAPVLCPDCNDFH